MSTSAVRTDFHAAASRYWRYFRASGARGRAFI